MAMFELPDPMGCPMKTRKMLETSSVFVAYPNNALLIAIGGKIMRVLFSKVTILYSM